MNIKKILLSTVVLFVTALVWNGFLHMYILKEANQLTMSLRRENLNEFMGLSMVMTFSLTLLFSMGYAKIRKSGALIEGICYGIFFALIAGLLVDLNQYILYPLPGRLAFYWFLGGLLEFSLYGAIATKLYQ